MIKRVASITLGLALFQTLAFAAETPAAPPLLTIMYGDPGLGTAPLIFSYSVWANGDVRYEPSPVKHNQVKTRDTKTLHVSPEIALRSIKELIKVGFLALQPEVEELSASEENGVTRLDEVVLSHSLSLTVQFHFANKDFKTEIADITTLPWALPALQKVEKDLGITALVE
jgi:hypothetical protein